MTRSSSVHQQCGRSTFTFVLTQQGPSISHLLPETKAYLLPLASPTGLQVDRTSRRGTDCLSSLAPATQETCSKLLPLRAVRPPTLASTNLRNGAGERILCCSSISGSLTCEKGHSGFSSWTRGLDNL